MNRRMATTVIAALVGVLIGTGAITLAWIDFRHTARPQRRYAHEHWRIGRDGL